MPKSRTRKDRRQPRRRQQAGKIRDVVWPVAPDLVMSQGERLTHSPAHTWLNLEKEPGVSDGARTLIERWPFKIVRAGKPAPDGYGCIRLLAEEIGMSVRDCALAMAELEDKALVLWSNEHNVYVMGPETADVHNTEDGLAAADEVFRQLAAETPAQRAERRWNRPTIVAVPGDPDGQTAQTDDTDETHKPTGGPG